MAAITIDFLIYADHKLLSKQKEDGAGTGEEEGGGAAAGAASELV